MTNQEIVELARDKGFNAEIAVIFGAASIWLTNRKVGRLEIETALQVPSEVTFLTDRGVMVCGIDS